MTQIIPPPMTAMSALNLSRAAPALLESCSETIVVLATVADLPNLPTQLRIDIARAMAKACEAHHLAKFGKIT